MFRFVLHALPLLVLLLAVFGFAADQLDLEPRSGAVIRFSQPHVPGRVVIGTWLVEAAGLLAIYLLAQGRCGAWWLDGLVAGSLAWIFRGPLLVITIVVAARQPQQAWWILAFGWWVLYSVCGLALALLARREQAAHARPAAAETATAESEEGATETPAAVAEEGAAEEPSASELRAEPAAKAEPQRAESEAETEDRRADRAGAAVEEG